MGKLKNMLNKKIYEICKEEMSGNLSITVDNSSDNPTVYINTLHEWERKPWWHTFNRGDDE